MFNKILQMAQRHWSQSACFPGYTDMLHTETYKTWKSIEQSYTDSLYGSIAKKETRKGLFLTKIGDGIILM